MFDQWKLQAAFVPTLLIVTLLAAGCSDSTEPTPEPKTLESRIADLMANAVGPAMPGASLCLIGDGIDITLAAGKADIAQDAAMTTDHRFHAASVGKSFMGAAFARLAVIGQVDLEDSLATWLPPELLDGIPSSELITARHLLQHTSGIIDVHNENDDLITVLEADPTRILTNLEQAEFAKGHPLHFPPGSDMRYSNTNYIFLALILEEITEQDFATALHNLVFEPLGMTATTTSNHETINGPLSLGYMISGADYDTALDIALRWEAGSGGQWTTATDLARFAHGIAETDLVLDDAGRQLMLTGSAHSTYGLGIDSSESPYGPTFWHNGRLFGYVSFVWYFPEAGLAVGMVANAVEDSAEGPPASDKLLIDIMDEVFKTMK